MSRDKGSCVTLNCSYGGQEIGAMCWEQNSLITVYHLDKSQINKAFKNQTWFFSEPLGNCSLQLVGLCPGDQGTNWVWIQQSPGPEWQPGRGSVQLRVTGERVLFPLLVASGRRQGPQNSALAIWEGSGEPRHLGSPGGE